MAYYCLNHFQWPPSRFLELPPREKAFVQAAILIRIDEEKRLAQKAKM